MNDFDQIETSLTKGCLAHKPSSMKKRRTKTSSSCAKNFKRLWNEMESKIEAIESSWYEKTLEAVAKFVRIPVQQTDEIPAAVIQMGVNMPDHGNILKQLAKLLRMQKAYPVILESRKCSTGTSTMQFIHNELQNLSSEVKSSPSKQARYTSQLKPLLALIIQDVETFSVQVVEELIWNCKMYLRKLPVVLIFGMSSAMVTLHSILPQRVLCHLGIETFHSFAAAEYLTRIIEEVVMCPRQPFKLGPRVLRLVVDTLLYHDFSVTNLKHLLRFSLMKHFYNNKGSVLLCSESERREKISGLQDSELQFLKKLPSLQLYLENNPSASLGSSSSLKLLLTELIGDLYKSQDKMMLSLRVLHNLTKDLPGSPLGKQFREIYLLNLEKPICQSTAFKEAQKLLKFQSQSELLSKLQSCREMLKSHEQRDLREILDQSIQKLTDLSSEDFNKKVLENETFTNRFQLQERMRSSIHLRRSRFEAVRSEIIDTLFDSFKDVGSPFRLPLSEVFFFDDVHACKRHLMPSPRVVLCRALTHPQQYLECKCCNGEISSSLPDLSMLYKLHLECGKLINLCDWLEAFKSLKSASRTKTDDVKLNIRFLLAATELQLMGFVKPTRRKTDHVARLTF